MKRAALVGLVASIPGTARAHSPLPGLEGFYAGMVHPVAEAASALVIAGLALRMGQLDPSKAGPALLAFSGAAIAGTVIAALGVSASSVLLLVVAAIVACMTAAALALPVALEATVAGVAGVLVGLAIYPDPGSLREILFTTTGGWVGACLALLLLSGGVGILTDKVAGIWPMVALRAASSWVVAISLLMLALHSGEMVTTVPAGARIGE